MKFTTTLTNLAGRTGLKIQKYSPQLLLGAGITTFVGTVVLACKATTRAEDVINAHNDNMAAAKEAQQIIEDTQNYSDIEILPEYENFDIKKEKVIIYSHTMVGFAKLYAPTMALGALSLACFFKAYNIINTRYLGAVAAYNAVSGAFDMYRQRVKAELGDQMDRHFRYGTEIGKIEYTELTEDGKVKKHKEEVEDVSVDGLSQYAAIFDRRCSEWDENALFNYKWLRANETAANDILRTRGHIFLNEVYDMIGLPHTPEGAVAGWIKDQGDGYVDFGLWKDGDPLKRTVNGKENEILLDFNVDGIIFDKI